MLPCVAGKWTHMVEDKEFVVVNTGAHWGNHSVRNVHCFCHC